MATTPEPQQPDIEPMSPPESPPLPAPMEDPDEMPDEIEPPQPDYDQPDPGIFYPPPAD